MERRIGGIIGIYAERNRLKEKLQTLTKLMSEKEPEIRTII